MFCAWWFQRLTLRWNMHGKCRVILVVVSMFLRFGRAFWYGIYRTCRYCTHRATHKIGSRFNLGEQKDALYPPSLFFDGGCFRQRWCVHSYLFFISGIFFIPFATLLLEVWSRLHLLGCTYCVVFCEKRVYLFSFLFFRRMLLLPKDCGNIDCQIPRPPYYDMYRLVMVRGILFSVVYPSVLVCCILFGRAHHPILASRILVFNNFLCYSCRFVVYEGR